LNPLAPLYRAADRLRYRIHADAGKRGEDLAHRFLRRQGLLIVARNWRPPQGGGEIDLIACEPSSAWDTPFGVVRSANTLVFVEVKTRVAGSGAGGNAPERDIDNEKMTALRRAARDYVRRARADPERVRFDVISVVVSGAGGDIRHIRDAFPALSVAGPSRHSLRRPHDGQVIGRAPPSATRYSGSLPACLNSVRIPSLNAG